MQNNKKINLKDLLSGNLIFGGMPETMIQVLESAGRIQSLVKDEMIFFEGDRGDKIYFLTEGLVKLFKTTESDREIVVRYVRPGEMFAEVVLFESDIYPVSSMAMRDSKIYYIERDFFLDLLKEKDFMRLFVSNLFKKMRYLADRVAFLNAYDVEERFFIFLNDHFGLEPVISIDLSKAEMAEAIGTIPETMSRVLGRLKTNDFVQWDKNEIKINVDYAMSVIEKVKVN